MDFARTLPRSSPWRIVAAVTGIVAVVVLVAAWFVAGSTGAGRPAAAGTPAGVTPRAAAATSDTLQLVDGGIPHPLTAGTPVPLAGDLVATVSLRPSGDGRFDRTLDLVLSRQGPPVQSVDGATVRVVGNMRFMDHGSFAAAALPVGGGHYLLSLPFIMPGDWELDLTIVTPQEQATLVLYLTFWD